MNDRLKRVREKIDNVTKGGQPQSLNEKDYLYKYITTEGLLSIVNNNMIKWSSPLLFNDPFDIQLNIKFRHEKQEFEEQLTNMFVKLAYGEKEPIPYDKGDKSSVLNTIIQYRKSDNKLPKNEFKTYIKPLVSIVEEMSDENIKILNGWYQLHLKELIVLCLAETYDNLLMWSHYAENHKGAVIRLKCLHGQDRPLCGAVKVEYADKMPVIAELQEWIEYLVNQGKEPFYNKYTEFIYTKSKAWAYEDEWRCVTKKQKNNKQPYEFSELYPEELSAIYLGCRMEEGIRNKICGTVNKKHPHVQIFQAQKDKKKYKLLFNRIN